MSIIAERSEEVLQHFYGDAPWIHQAVEVVKNGLAMAIDRFDGRELVAENAHSGADHMYQFPPRSAEEIKATIAAEEAAVTEAGNGHADGRDPMRHEPEVDDGEVSWVL